MNKKRFSDLELYTLRNSIPVQTVINTLLHIPSEMSDGYFRFLCPICHGYNTAVKTQTNLARCFTCKKNFNTIDLVMISKNLNFVQSIAFLKHFYYPPCQNTIDPPPQKKTSYTPANKPNKGMEKISHILNAMIKQADTDTKTNTSKQTSPNYDQVIEQVHTLERKVEYLLHKINTIHK